MKETLVGIALAGLLSACLSGEAHRMFVPPEAHARLERLRAKPKFEEEGLYPGPASEADKTKAEAAINDLVTRLEAHLALTPTEETLMFEVERTLDQLVPLDSEDRDQSLQYIEEAMDAVGLKSSGGVLNRWRYGFDPRSLPENGNGS